MTRRIRALVVLTTGQPGGAELAAVTIMRHAPPDVDLHFLLLTPGPAADTLREMGLPVAVAGLAGRPSPRRAAGFQRALLRLLRRLEPDVVLAVGVKAAVLSAPATRAARVPIVWQKVDFAYDHWLTAPLARVCSGVVAVSAAVAAAVPPGRLLAVIPPPVRLADDYRVAAERPPATIGSVGMLVPYKGHHHVIEAGGRLRERFPELRIVIAGGMSPAYPDYEERLREVARRWQVDDRLELTGHLERVEDVFDRLSVFVSATYRDEQGFGQEGLSGAMLEASWAGLPVVATAGGGTPEGVRDGVTGMLVPPADPARLAGAIADYLADPDTARAAGEEGARFARERFQPATLAPRLFTSLRAVAR